MAHLLPTPRLTGAQRGGGAWPRRTVAEDDCPALRDNRVCHLKSWPVTERDKKSLHLACSGRQKSLIRCSQFPVPVTGSVRKGPAKWLKRRKEWPEIAPAGGAGPHLGDRGAIFLREVGRRFRAGLPGSPLIPARSGRNSSSDRLGARYPSNSARAVATAMTDARRYHTSPGSSWRDASPSECTGSLKKWRMRLSSWPAAVTSLLARAALSRCARASPRCTEASSAAATS